MSAALGRNLENKHFRKESGFAVSTDAERWFKMKTKNVGITLQKTGVVMTLV